MKNNQLKSLANALKRIAMKDYFDDQDGKELLVALQELIASLEQSEELVTAEQLAEAVKAFFADRLKDGQELPEEIQNTIRKAVRDYTMPVRAHGLYLDSKEAVHDFRNAIIKSRNAEEFASNWKAHLTRNAITGVAYPTEVSKGIAAAWDRESGLLGRMTKVASKGFKLMYTTEGNASANVVAHGHETKGTAKVEQEFTVLTKDLTLEMVYKWIPVDRIDLASLEDDAAFIDWIVTELSDRLAYTIERTVIAGDPNSTTGQRITSLESIGAKTTSDIWTTVISGTPSAQLAYSAVVATEGRNRWLYVAKDALATILNIDYGAGSPSSLFLTLEQLKEQWGVEKVIPFDFPRASPGTIGSGEIVAVALSPEDYYRIGGEPFGEQWSIYEKNQEAFMAEVAIGGGVGKAHASAVALAS